MKSFDALRLICRILSYQGEEGDKALKEELTSSTVEWPVVIKVASVYYLSTAIYPALTRKGLLDSIPPDALDYFSGVLELNRERNQKLRDQTLRLATLLNEIDIEPLLLKGMANIFSGIYEDPGARVMNDIDVMIPEQRLSDCVDKLHSAGYQDLAELGPDRHHYNPMGHPDEIGMLELHMQPVVNTFEAIVPTESMWADSESVEAEGARMRIASATQRALHNIVHMQLQHGTHHVMYFHQMYDLVIIRKDLDENIEWRLVERLFRDGKQPGALHTYLANASYFLSCKKPDIKKEHSVLPFFSLWFLKLMTKDKYTWKVFIRLGKFIKLIRRIRATLYARRGIRRKLTRLKPLLDGLVKKSQ